MKTYISGYGFCRLTFIEGWIILNLLIDVIERLISHVILQDIQYKAFFDGLSHAVNMVSNKRAFGCLLAEYF